MKVAIIPARGGSKRIPRKNIKEFFGKPMIAWSIEAALKSNCFDRVIVSTDDKEIANIAEDYGAEVPFIRPAELSDDHAGTIPVIKQAIQWLNDYSQPPSLVCCLYATAPFVRVTDIIKGLGQLEQKKASYAFAVTSYAFPIQRAIKINDTDNIEMFTPEHFQTRSQDLEEAYHDAGQFYWGKKDAFLEAKPFFDENSVIVKLPRDRVQDIDTPEDWDFAEKLYSVINK